MFFLLFVLPVGPVAEGTLVWADVAQHAPWNIMLLCAGAVAMTDALANFGFIELLLQESAFPLADKRRRAAHRLLHLRIACTVCQQEQHPSDPRVIRSTATARNSFAKLPMFRLSQHNGSPFA